MKLGDIDPQALRDWAREAWENSSPGETIELHVTPRDWQLIAPREEPQPFLIEPEGAA